MMIVMGQWWSQPKNSYPWLIGQP